MHMLTRGRHRMVTKTSKTTNFRARFFYNTFLCWLANLHRICGNFQGTQILRILL